MDTSDIANRTLPAWLLPGLSNQEIRACSRPDAIILLRRETPHSFRIHTTHTSVIEQLRKGRLTPRRCDAHLIEFKHCENTRPEPQLRKAQEQHAALVNSFRNQGYTTVTLHVILTGVMGTIYIDYTDQPLKKLGLAYLHAKKADS